MKKVIYDDSSLNAVSDSNHVCAIQGLGFYPWEIFVRGQYNVHRNEGDCRVTKMAANAVEQERYSIYLRRETNWVQMPNTWREKWAKIR